MQSASHIKKNKITQCYNCHSSTNCYLPPRCAKCPGNHKSSDCTVVRENKIIVDNNGVETLVPVRTAICTNCGGKHPANFSGCENRKKLLDKAEKSRDDAKARREFKTQSYNNKVTSASFAC